MRIAGEPELQGEPVQIFLETELGQHARLTCATQRAAPRRLGNQRLERRSERGAIALLDQMRRHAFAQQFRNRRYTGGNARQALALRLGEDVWQAVPVAVAS